MNISVFSLTTLILVIAIVISNSIKNRIHTRFCLKSGVDLTSSAALQNKLNWIQTSLTCTPGNEVACTITVSDEYTHINNSEVVLNYGSFTPQIIIQTENGLLYTIPEPDVQYLRIKAGIGYTFVNTVLE
jgi:hypothetical protein